MLGLYSFVVPRRQRGTVAIARSGGGTSLTEFAVPLIPKTPALVPYGWSLSNHCKKLGASSLELAVGGRI
jgi:hypothetical protein